MVSRELILLLLIGVSFAIPVCPSYPYRDYVDASQYRPPQKPPDTLLQYCSISLDPMCLLTNLLNNTDDKKFFIAESIANGSFANIRQWNEKIAFGKYPPNSSKSSTNIKDAWVSLAYLNPSVYDNGTYLINTTAQPLIRQAFTFVVERRMLSGDCRDDYRICGYSYSITTKNTSQSITATLNARSEYLVDRYVWVTHCSLFGCWQTCDYYRTDSFKDSLSTSDSKKVKYQNFSSKSNYSIVAYYNGLSEILINANNPNVYFQIGNSTFYKTDHLYKTRYEAGPYNILIKEVVPANETYSYGLGIIDRNGSQFRILAPYSKNCFLTASDHFSSKTVSGCAITNLTNNSTGIQIQPKTPKIFDSFLQIAGLGIVFYVLYKIVQKVMPNA